MRTRVVISDHLTHIDHVSEWCVSGSGFAPIEGAVHAAFVKAFGTSADRITILSLDERGGTGELTAKGMNVSVVTVADQDAADSYMGQTYERPRPKALTIPRPRRPIQRIEYRGENLTILEWAKRFGLTYQALSNRLSFGWSIEEALTTRVDDGGKNPWRKVA